MHKTNYQNFISCADIGGSHITAAVVNIQDRTILEKSRIRIAVNSRGTWADILGTWAEALTASIRQSGTEIEKIGIAMPGPFDYQQGISWIKGLNKYDAIYGINVKNYFAKEFDLDPQCVLFRNDAESFLHGEVLAGAGTGFVKTIGITLGTGLGSARSLEGTTEDVNRGSSKFGTTIADDYMSTRWFVQRYYELTGLNILNVKELIDKGEESDIVESIFGEFSTNLTSFLNSFIADEQPDLLIIGGNIARAWPLFLPAVKASIYLPEHPFEIRIAELGEDSALMGAAFSFEPLYHAQNYPINFNTLSIKP